jgi:hypothetical protein
MTKKFTLLQLFSLVDGRLSTKIEDVYDMLNHICDTQLMTHHLPVAMNYLKEKNPKWFQEISLDIEELRMIVDGNDFEKLMVLIKTEPNNKKIDIPQLKDEFDTSDFGKYMGDNSLLKIIGTKLSK